LLFSCGKSNQQPTADSATTKPTVPSIARNDTPKPDGKYGKGNIEFVEFKSGKVTLTAFGNSQTCDYTVDGDKITVSDVKAKYSMVSVDGGFTTVVFPEGVQDNGTLVFTLKKDGSLQGSGGDHDTYTKSDG